MTKPLYQVLGLDESATPAEIKAAYRTLSKECHPNNPENAGDASKAQRWEAISQAYKVLMDEDRRNHYDETGAIKESREDQVRTKALQQCIAWFLTAIIECPDPDQADMVEAAKTHMIADRVNTENKRDELLGDKLKLQKAQRRLKLKDVSKENPLATAMNNMIGDIDKALEKAQYALDINTAAGELLDSYSYEYIQQMWEFHTPQNMHPGTITRVMYYGNRTG